MATEVIFENVRYFFEKILRNATFDNDWDKESIKNAIHWAQYCEKLYHQTQAKSFSKKLNTFMVKLNSKTILLALNFKSLRDATRILYMALLQNPFLSRELVNFLLQENQMDETFAKDLCHIVQLKSEFLALEEWVKLKPNLNGTVAELYLECLRNKFLATEDKFEKEKLTHSFFNFLMTSENELLHLVEMWMLPPSNCEMEEIRKLFLKILLKKISPKEPTYDANATVKVWNLSPAILSGLSSSCIPFLEIYCDHLVFCAQKLELQYIENDFQWLSREGGRGCLNYSDIVTHFKTLWNSQGEVREYVSRLLLQLSAGSVCSIWEDITNEIKQFVKI
ncbi:uncharacterized protein [Centruroides vittatus]|uniref:uncharacterized protein n=1 Tax=Centruroides vittatus TaxID=120091 RepID=UPI00350FB925